VGLAITALLFAFGATVSTGMTLKQDPFHASIAQFVCAAIFCIAAMLAAFVLPGDHASTANGAAPSPWLPGAAALIAGSIFMTAPKEWGWTTVAIYLVLDVAMISLVMQWSRSAGWSALHRLALAGGAALAYAWHAFIQAPAVGKADAVDRVGNAIFAAALISLL
jgi:hypothetical protein